MRYFTRNFTLAVVILLFIQCSNQSSTDTVVLRVPVTIEEVAKGDIASYISLTGTLSAKEEMPIIAEVGGVIKFSRTNGRLLTKGDRVTKDQVIATLINEDFVLSVRIESKKLAMDNAVKDLEEKERLVELGGTSQREVETARRTKLDAELNYQAALLDLEKMNVKVPMNGIFAESAAIIDDQKINQGDEIGKVMRYNKVKCELNITNDDIGKIRIGQEVNITNFAYEDEIFTGNISKISPTIDPQTRTFQIEVEIENSDLRLRPGMFVKADIVVEKKSRVLRIPKYTILTRNNREVVFVVEDQVAKLKEVTVGIRDVEYAEILEGIAEGDRLVVRGYETLKDNTKVRVSR